MITSIRVIISIKTKGDIQCLIKTHNEEHEATNRIKNITQKKITNLCKLEERDPTSHLNPIRYNHFCNLLAMCREEEENTIASRTTTNQNIRMSSNLSDRILNRDIIRESQILGNIKKEVEKMILNIKEERLKFIIRKIKIE